ncbi:MAG TPA: TonB family protein [Terriglobales bacterium]|jgi:protein TonB
MPLYEQEQNRALGMRRSLSPVPITPEQKQRRQMLTALGLLVMALALVIFKNKDFWFPPSQVAQVETTSQPATTAPVAVATAPAQEKHRHALTHKVNVPVTVASAKPEVSAPVGPVVTNRAVLPPLEIEVVSGNEAQTAQERNNSVGLDMSAGAHQTAQAPSANDLVNNASQSSERVRLSTDTTQVLTHPVEPNYPLLAKEMKVQGSVVLQALIGKDGKIQDLRTVSGPTILSSAAREAVQQWRFKPYYQSGQAMETVARITVNFTISAN